VNVGQEVIVPKSNVQVGSWTGTGDSIVDLETGSGAYKISGGSNGSCVDRAIIASLGI